MLRGTRSLHLDICDYENNIVCNLYDNQSDVSGQATDVFVTTERNGWKELSFTIPSTCMTMEGKEENYRLQYLIADYRIRLKTDNKTDYYLISEPRIVHNGPSKNVEVVAGHISQLLKTKNLGLEFSDEEGNNVGTAAELLQTILDGTGWTVGNVTEFLEDDGKTVKVRSLVASAKTGAFALIANMCEKFDARPEYNGETRTVDIVPLNPFSDVEGSEIPKEVLNGKTALELNYGRNISNLTRTLNTENLVTRLYAYGAYGDKTNGLCSLQTVEHQEYNFTLEQDYPEGTEFRFADKDGINHYFTLSSAAEQGEVLIWSDMDQTSRSYIWNDTRRIIYKIHPEPEQSTWITLTSTRQSVANKFDYLMDFTYYDKIGLLTDNMRLELAKFQRDMPAVVDRSTEASAALIESEQELSRIAENNTGFLRLDVASFSAGTNGEVILNIRKSNYSDGVIYRSDFNESRRNYFSWYCAESLKENGDPAYGIGSVVYIVHDTDPITWDKAYLKEIDGEVRTQDYSVRGAADPDTVTLWLSFSKTGPLKAGDRVYLFATNSISGRLGVRESEIESLQQTLDQATKVVTEKHPTYFVWDNDPAPTLDVVKTGYGWYYRSSSTNDSLGQLYFCYGLAGDTRWKQAVISETEPAVISGGYYFNLKSKNLYHGESSGWVNIADSGIIISGSASPYWAPNAEAKRLSQSFSKVAYYCLRHDMLYKGIYDKYTYTADSVLHPGNYAFKSEYGFYWVFTTDQEIESNKQLWIDTIKYLVFQNESIESVVTPEAKPYEAIDFPVANELTKVSILSGSIIKATGVEENSTVAQRTNHITVYGGVNYQYSLPTNSYVVFFDSNRRYLDYTDLDADGTFATPIRAKYARFVFQNAISSSHFVQVKDYQNQLFVKETQYAILSPLTGEGSKAGINALMEAFADTADECYLHYLTEYQAAQKEVKDADDALKDALQDLYREGYWQKNEYVEGDEEKLYKDALDNLEKIAKPEATYDIQFLDLYSSNTDAGYSVLENPEEVEWPDIDISDAMHLVDEDIGVNCWAFIDKLEKCYDQPWKTRMTINTDLSLIAQHSFTDVLTRIAEVANETSAKQTIYKRAAAISGSGAYAADKLEGTIKANKTLFEGGASNWYTDNKGNMVFESTDGQSAMMLTGYGFCISNTKDADGDWIFRNFGTGAGFSADEMVTGEMSALRLIAGTITTDLLHASVGQELEIGSNKSLLLYATVDGFRPSGGLLTQVSNGDGTYRPVQEGDSFIQIAAKEGNTPAYIDIMTGGLLNLQGSTMNLTAQSVMNLTSGDMYIDADGQIHMKAGSDLDVESGATISVESDGDINIKGGADINVLSDGKVNLQSGSMMYIGSGADMYVQSGGDLYIQAGSSIDIASGSTFTVDSTNFVIDEHGNVLLRGTVYAWAGNIGGWIIAGEQNQSGTGWKRQYIYTGNIDSVRSTGAGAYLGTDGINIGGKLRYDLSKLAIEAESVIIGKQSTGSGTLLSMNAQTGQIRLLASSTIDLTASAAVNISAGQSVNIASTGSIVIGNLGSPFTIGSNGTNAYIYNGMTSLADTQHNGVYVGTDGIALGKGLFKVANSGTLTATSATITGEINAITGKIGVLSNGTGGWTINSNLIYANDQKTGMSSTVGTNGSGIAFWAGNKITDLGTVQPSFYVTHAGYLKSTSGAIGGWVIGDTTLTSSNGTVGMHSNSAQTNQIAFWAGSATPASAPFYVTHGGTLKAVGAELQSANVYGNIYAASGNIGGTISGTSVTGGWSITANQISSNNGLTGLSSASGNSNIAFWAGNSAPSSANFKVTNGGTLTAVNAVLNSATVTGTIYATSGRIGGTISGDTMTGGWIINNNVLSSGSTSNYVGLSSNTSSDYAIWAGAASPDSANFYVKRNGEIYANSGTFNGKITAGTGSTIGGWYIGTDRIRSGNASGGGITGMASSTAINAVAFWAGSTTPSNAPFYVTAGGYLNATNVSVEGTIKANALYIGGREANISLDSSGKITLGSLNSDSQTSINKAAKLMITNDKVDISCLSDNASAAITKAANISVTNGRIDLSSLSTKVVNDDNLTTKLSNYATITVMNNAIEQGVWDELGNASGITITKDSVRIKTGGTFSVASGNFSVSDTGNVTMTGTITAGSGSTIGGWNIGSNSFHSGSGSYYVGLSSNTSSKYAIWAGASTASSAPFRVKRDGTVDLTKLNTITETGETEQVINLTQYPLWKLWYSVIKSYTDNSITLSNGTTINFNTASSITSGWSGGALTVYVKNKSGDTVLKQEVASLSFNRTEAQIKTALENSSTHSCTLTVDDEDNEWTTIRTNIDASGVYNNGWNDCIDKCTSIEVVRNSTEKYDGTLYTKQGTEYISMGTGTWRLGGFSATAYIIPQKKT